MDASVYILVPSEWSTTQRGNYFESLVSSLLQRMRFRVYERVRFTGMEIDCLAENLDNQEKVYVECKFLKDPFESEIIPKLTGKALQRKILKTYLFSTAQPGKDAKGVLIEIKNENNLIGGIVKFAFIGPVEFVSLYTDITGINGPEILLSQLPPNIKDFLGSVSLAIAPEEAFWVVEVTRAGIPEKAYLVPVRDYSQSVRDFDTAKRLIEDAKLWVGLPLENGISTTLRGIDIPSPVNVVTSVPSADKFDDYRPARPEEFVGRNDLIKEVLGLLQQIRSNNTQSRVVAISGLSGFGKSSIVLNIANKCRNSSLANSIYICPIDTRSAISPLFIVEAIKFAFQRASADKFLDDALGDAVINSVEDPFSSPSIQACLNWLVSSRKIIVLFFDQFEELFVKESLFDTFEAFRRFAYAVEALQSNVVLGFSWRTGISIPDTHPAHQIWHELRDHRVEFKIGPFTEREASAMVDNLEKALGNRVEPVLKRQLIEQSQNLPWLLKKFCVHIYNKLRAGLTQRELIGNVLDAATLFGEDTQSLQSIEIDCLRFIARNSPADVVLVHEKYGHEIPERLYANRLIIRSGHRFSVYWDIFREFLVTGTVPPIPITHIPQSQLSTALNVFRHIRTKGPVTAEDICDAFGYTIKTAWNISADLTSYFLVERDQQNKMKVIDELVDAEDNELAGYIATKLSNHVVYVSFKNRTIAGQSLWRPDIEDILAEAYPLMSYDTLRKYASRLLPWFDFAGLIEFEEYATVVRPFIEGKGRNTGKVLHKRNTLINGKPTFVCSASPRRVVDLATRLVQMQELSRATVEGNSDRNAALDLSSLGLAQWKNKTLVPIGLLRDVNILIGIQTRKECYNLIKEQALASSFLSVLTQEITRDGGVTEERLYLRIRDKLNKDWTYESTIRYVEAGKSWLNYFNYFNKITGQKSFDFLDELG
jgi:Holliday junction resolvase-like predicted endonuclease